MEYIICMLKIIGIFIYMTHGSEETIMVLRANYTGCENCQSASFTRSKGILSVDKHIIFGKKKNNQTKGSKPEAKRRLKEKREKRKKKNKKKIKTNPCPMSKCVSCPSKEEKPTLPCPTSCALLLSNFMGGGNTPVPVCQSPGCQLFSLQAEKLQMGTNSFQPLLCPLC